MGVYVSKEAQPWRGLGLNTETTFTVHWKTSSIVVQMCRLDNNSFKTKQKLVNTIWNTVQCRSSKDTNRRLKWDITNKSSNSKIEVYKTEARDDTRVPAKIIKYEDLKITNLNRYCVESK